MVSLQTISEVYASGGAPIWEQSGRLQINAFELDSYPEINLNCETHTTTASTFDTCRNVLVPVNEGVVKRIIRTFFESGFHEALNEAKDSQTAAVAPVICSMAEFTCRTLALLDRLKAKIFPHAREQGIGSIANYSETRDWIRSYIRCIDWHPNCFKIAVAGSDDIIRIYTDEPAVVPVLKSTSQRWISGMAWRPFSAGELAVACQKGICLWTMDNNMHITRTSSQAVFLRHPNNCTMSGVQWNPDGNLLATCSIGDADVLIWNVDKMLSSPLKRVGPPCSLLKWSPDGVSLFSATVGNVFRVWSVDKSWTPERWTISTGRIQSACWSPCGAFLLFVTSTDPILYRLQFIEEQLFASGNIQQQALPIADLSKFAVDNREVGGQPQCIAWDPNGCYLAITFQETNLIAVFATCVRKFNLTVSPTCFVSGVGREHPSFICFQSKNHKNSATVLTIGWSSGRIQYFPLASG